MEILLPLLAFVFGLALVTAAACAFMPARAMPIDRRLEELIIGGDERRRREPRLRQRLVDALQAGRREGAALAQGDGQAAPAPGAGRLSPRRSADHLLRHPARLRARRCSPSSRVDRDPPNITLALGGLALGYLLPGMALARLAKRRQHQIRLSLADMLDLLVVSVEAGLGLDQAIQRVGDELAFAYPELSDELRLINLELRAGKPRSEALRNLADRTGVDDLSSLVTMLIQTDKFGTSVAQSLRVYSETLRTKRRQRAEEAAAKTGVKMVFPLVFCIFPAIWVVTIGPAAIKFVTVLFPMVENEIEMRRACRAHTARPGHRVSSPTTSASPTPAPRAPSACCRARARAGRSPVDRAEPRRAHLGDALHHRRARPRRARRGHRLVSNLQALARPPAAPRHRRRAGTAVRARSRRPGRVRPPHRADRWRWRNERDRYSRPNR